MILGHPPMNQHNSTTIHSSNRRKNSLSNHLAIAVSNGLINNHYFPSSSSTIKHQHSSKAERKILHLWRRRRSGPFRPTQTTRLLRYGISPNQLPEQISKPQSRTKPQSHPPSDRVWVILIGWPLKALQGGGMLASHASISPAESGSHGLYVQSRNGDRG